MAEYKYTDTLLRTVDLRLEFKGKPILKNITVDIRDIVRPGMQQGQVVALLGPSGCGKTQLFRCIAGLQVPTSGMVVLDGKTTPVQPGDVGVVQQDYPLMLHRTVMGNLLMPRQATQDRAQALLKRFGLADKAGLYPMQLSGGQRQRVAIMQQMLLNNHFVLMDEPFSGLDIISKTNVCKLINEVTTENELNTVIFTTHDIESAVTIADHIWIMGHDRDAEGISQGAVIRKMYDLIELDLAWNPDIMRHPNFYPTIAEIKELFPSLQ